VINACFNYQQFWDGRANHLCNAVSPFGKRDESARLIKYLGDDECEQVGVLIDNASICSQSLGPVLSDFEMSCQGRNFLEVGKKLVHQQALMFQDVSDTDSILGHLSCNFVCSGPEPHGACDCSEEDMDDITGNVQIDLAPDKPGVSRTYQEMIEQAFYPQWWGSGKCFTPEGLVCECPDDERPDAVDPGEFLLGSGAGEVNPGRGPIVVPNPDVILPEPLTIPPLFPIGDSGVGADEVCDPDNFLTQFEYNFSLFWSLSIMAYLNTQVSDMTPFDNAGHQAEGLSDEERHGLAIFLGKARCVNCHGTAAFSNATTFNIDADDNDKNDNNFVERMFMGDANIDEETGDPINRAVVALYDNGYYNIGVTPTDHDIGRGNLDPFDNPLSYVEQFVANPEMPIDMFNTNPCKFDVIPDECIEDCTIPPDAEPDFEPTCEGWEPPADHRIAVKGAFKTPQLRNVWLTGPYFHPGSYSTLRQVVEFYNRGGNRRGVEFGPDTTGCCEINDPQDPEDDFCPDDCEPSNLDPDIRQLGLTEIEIDALVAFLKSLTDDRVAFKQAPFDHPSIIVPNGHSVGDDGDESMVLDGECFDVDHDMDGNTPLEHVCEAVDSYESIGGMWIEIPAVGAAGISEKLKPFDELLGCPDPQ